MNSYLFDKLYSYFSTSDENKNTNYKFKIDSLTKKIISELDSNVIIINRDDDDFPENFKKLCLDTRKHNWKLKNCFDSLKKSGINQKKWITMDEDGHWNQYAHKAIGIMIGNKLINIIKNNMSNEY